MINIGIPSVAIQNDTKTRPLVMVASHERSGTHFLMNSAGGNSLYSSSALLNFDYVPLGSLVNFHSLESVGGFLSFLHQHHCISIIKSHFAAEFFGADILGGGKLKVLYIHRNPLDVMKSYKNFIDSLSWHEGPRTQTLKEFILAEPAGQMLRYQTGQKRSILQRWEHHVVGWLRLAEKFPNVKCIRYEDLQKNHAVTMQGVLGFMGLEPPKTISYPSRDKNVVKASKSYRLSADEEQECRALINSGIESEELRSIYSGPGAG